MIQLDPTWSNMILHDPTWTYMIISIIEQFELLGYFINTGTGTIIIIANLQLI